MSEDLIAQVAKLRHENQELRDTALVEHVVEFPEENYAIYGICKMWPTLRDEGIDIAYARTHKGFVYTAFITDVFSRRIVGWALSESITTEALPLQALNQMITCAKETSGLIHHFDHGLQYVSIVHKDHLD